MKTLLRRLLLIFFVVLIVSGALYLFPLDSYIPQAEKELGDQLHETVSIQQLRLVSLPLPHLAVRGVHIGSKPGISIQKINIGLVWSDLLSGKVALRISMQDAAANVAQIQKVITALTNAPATKSSVTLREVRLTGIDLTLPKMKLGPIEAKIDLDAESKPQRIWFAMDDKKISATILPLPNQGYSVLVEAHAWTVPQHKQILLDDLKLQGRVHNSAPAKGKNNFRFSGDIAISRMQLEIASNARHPLVVNGISGDLVFRDEQLDLSKLRAKLYGGKLTGSATLNLNRSLLSANISTSELTMQPLVQAFNNEVLFSGNMDGTARLTLPLNSPGQFMNGLQMQSQFNLRNGVISKIDLVEATKVLGKDTKKEASTSFDSLSGLLDIDASGYHFRDLKLISGALNASGKVNVDPALQLNGTLDANVKNTVGMVSMPMAVSGTVNDPVVRPTKSAMAGAAVGTAILGPGLGTAAGIKVGGFLNKLFGKDEEQKNEPAASSQTPVKK